MIVPKEINLKSMIYLNRKKMSSRECLAKHLRFKESERKAKQKKDGRQKLFIVKSKDVG